jgi:hypothetical protein
MMQQQGGNALIFGVARNKCDLSPGGPLHKDTAPLMARARLPSPRCLPDTPKKAGVTRVAMPFSAAVFVRLPISLFS